MMVLRKLAIAMLSVGVMLPGLGHALAVSELKTKSALGEPYRGEIELYELGDLGPDDIRVGLASNEDFERLGINRDVMTNDLAFDVVVAPGGRSFVRVYSTAPVREPFLDFVVRIAWPGNTSLKNLTALLDPPSVADVSTPPIDAPVSQAPAYVEPPALPPVLPPFQEPTSVTEAVAAPTPVPQEPAPVVVNTESNPQPAEPVAKKPTKTKASKPSPSESATTTEPAGEGEYRTQTGDTMASIAQRYRPDGVSAAQAMVAIQRANRAAFIDNNVNLLRRGQLLRIPSESDIRQISANEANASLREQTEAWRSRMAPAMAEAPVERAQIDATANPEPAVASPVVEPKPEVKILGAATGKEGSASAGNEKGAAMSPEDTRRLDENKAKLEAEKGRLTASVGSLDSKIKDNDAKLALQDAKLAELQAKLQELRTAQGEAPVVVESAIPAAAPAPAEKPAPVPVKPTVVAEAPAESEGFPLAIIGGVIAALGLGGGLFVWNRRRQQQAEEQAYASLMQDDEHVEPDAIFLTRADATSTPLNLGAKAPAATESEDDWLSAAPAAKEAPAAAPNRDVLQEVEQYLAYERYPQAAGMLTKALAGSPHRADLRQKLLEVYAKLDDHASFEQQENWFREAGDERALAYAQKLKATMTAVAKPKDHGVLDFEPSKKPAVADELPSLEDLEMDFNASVSNSNTGMLAVSNTSLNAVDDGLDLNDLDMDFSFEAPAAKTTSAAKSAAADDVLSLDDDLDFTLSTGESSTDNAKASDDLSFDLSDLDFGDTTTNTSSTAPADDGLTFSLDDGLLDEPKSTASAGKMSFGDLDDLPEVVEETPVPKTPEFAVSDDDFNISLDDLEAEPVASASDNDFDLDFSMDDTAVTQAPAMDSTMRLDETLSLDETVQIPPATGSASAGDDEFDFLADSDENATKLDLARAYIDMGDKEGARDILEEVLSEGSSTQKDEAKGLLAQVS